MSAINSITNFPMLSDIMDTIESISTKHSILFRGNSLDGWFAAYLAQTHFMGETKLYPVSAHQTSTWPVKKDITGTHIIMIEVNVPLNIREIWMKHGVLSVNWVDRYDSSYASLAEKYVEDMCVTKRVFSMVYPDMTMPAWISVIDRIARWFQITREDRCIREMLDDMIHMPVQKRTKEAIGLTQQFLDIMEQAAKGNSSPYTQFITAGSQKLVVKDAALTQILSNGHIHVFTTEHVEKWGLSANWLGANVFLLENTDCIIDTNEAAHLTFIAYPGLHVFINYRKKTVNGKITYVYSARSHNFDLTAGGGIFKGHPSSAGASITEDDAMFTAPFTA
jgi:hypothetical protein